MKKKLPNLAAALMLMLVLAGCGGKPIMNERAENDEVISAGDVSGASSVYTLAQWVESDRVKSAEDTINAYSDFTGMRAEFDAEGDDILIINCFYVKQLNLDGLDQEELETYFSSALSDISSTMDPLFTTCQEATDVKLQCVRVNYVNADGTMVYTYDFPNTK